MSLRRLIIRLRVFFTLLIVGLVVACASGLTYLHEKGLDDESAKRVAQEMERYGVFVTFDKLSLHILNGLTANNVRFYQTAERKIQIAELPALTIHVDKTKLMRGKLKINTISVTEAQLAIPLLWGDPKSPKVNISNVSGSIDLPGTNAVSTTGLSGFYEGIHVTLNCNIWRDSMRKKRISSPEEKQRIVDGYQQFLTHLKQWSWPANTPPELEIFIEGNLSTLSKVDFNYTLSSPHLGYKSYKMSNVILEGDWNQDLITLDKCEFNHQSERCSLTADFDTLQKSGRFKIDSTLHLQDFAQQSFGKRILKQFTIAGKSHIIADGKFTLNTQPADQPQPKKPALDLQMIGQVACDDFSFRGVSIHSLSSDFSWNNGDLYLDKVQVAHELGKLSGRLIIKDRLIRYKMRSSLPAQVFFPFIKSEGLKEQLAPLQFTQNSTIDVFANGSINQDDPLDWESHGKAELSDFQHRGVPIKFAKGSYAINRKTSDFTDFTAVFDYRDYALKRAYNGPESGTITAESLHFDWPEKQVAITNLRGSAWPAPILRLFAPKIADHLEEYRFTLPPTLSSSGIVSWQNGKKNATRLIVGFSSTGDTYYTFLKKRVPLKNARAQVTVLADKVQVNSLSATTFQGNLSGYIHVIPSSSHYSGRLQWDSLQLRNIAQLYGFKDIDAGYLTGSFTFRGKGSSVATLHGNGNISLAQGNLFAVPLFGPLSSLVDSVISPIAQQKFLHEQARNFSCNFSTKKGVFYTNDLSSLTKSTTFTGEGWIDLVKERVDLTIRMNFRGLMGLAEVPMKIIELPIQAFKSMLTGQQVEGLRQFHGTGPLSNPTWQFAPFQPPRDAKNDPIFQKPGRAEILR